MHHHSHISARTLTSLRELGFFYRSTWLAGLSYIEKWKRITELINSFVHGPLERELGALKRWVLMYASARISKKYNYQTRETPPGEEMVPVPVLADYIERYRELYGESSIF